jgi:hypothetical protein
MAEDRFISIPIARFKILLWIAAFIITISSAVYQRMTGPTYPAKGEIGIAGQTVTFKLLRSETVGTDALVSLIVPDDSIRGSVKYRRYKSNDEWTEIPMQRVGDTLAAYLPSQPPAGKIMYYVYLESPKEHVSITGTEPVVLRYKGAVPAGILIPHIFLMFLAMLFSNRTALEALDREGNARRYMFWTIGLFLVGGFILGPLVQKYAFGELWTGIPFGYDLTDNKTLIAMLGWLWAWYKNSGGEKRRGWYVFAALLMLAVYLIPHSVLGSEMDYTKTTQSIGVLG